MSDPQKRQSYDHVGARNQHFKFSQGTRASNFDFNFDDLFKQFEQDIFGGSSDSMKGHYQAHFKNHFGHHHQATGGGAFSFEDLVSEDGDFLREHFNFQGNLDFGEMFDAPDIFGADSQAHRKYSGGQQQQKQQQRCKTVTRRINNMVSTYTHCS